MPSIVFTALVSQSSVWLNAVAYANMPYIVVTALVSHALMFALKSDLFENNSYIDVTPVVTH